MHDLFPPKRLLCIRQLLLANRFSGKPGALIEKYFSHSKFVFRRGRSVGAKEPCVPSRSMKTRNSVCKSLYPAHGLEDPSRQSRSDLCDKVQGMPVVIVCICAWKAHHRSRLMSVDRIGSFVARHATACVS